MKKKYIRYSKLLVMLLLVCCGHTDEVAPIEPGKETFDGNHQRVMQKLAGKPDGSYVLIMAHRADGSSAPENSIAAIQNCIEQGLDIIEIDVHKTRDGRMILMHDNTLERTTNGAGNVADYTWEELKKLKLKDPDGRVTEQTIPLLEEAMLTAKDNIFVFLDKSYEHLNEIHEVLVRTGTLKQTAVDGIANLAQYQAAYPAVWQQLNLAARIGTGQSQAYINSHLANAGNVFLFPSCNLALSKSEAFKSVARSDRWLMFSTLANTDCSEDFESTWAWAIDQGMDIIITDKPADLRKFLRKAGKHS